MYKFIKENQKKMLAVFGVLLMVVFIIPPAAKYGQQRARRPIGRVGNIPIYADQRQEAAEEWDLLKRVQVAMPTIFLPPEYQQFVNPLQEERVPVIFRLGPLVQQIDQHRELFLLLAMHAEQEGIAVSDDQIKTFIVNAMRGGDVNDPRLVGTARRYLLVQALYDRVTANVKLSQPVWQRTMADQYQKVQLAMAEFPVEQFRKSVPAPTTQQVEQLYEQFKNVNPNGTKPPEDSLGFGYQTPTRVRIQYLVLPHKAVLDAVRGTKSAYDWEVEARRYYYSHENDFNRPPPTTGPATQPTTGPTTSPLASGSAAQPTTAPAIAATQVAPTSGPSTRPFAEVRDEIMNKVLEQPAKDLEQKIRDAISHRLATDFQADHPASGATRPADSAIVSKSYLDQVAVAIQKEFGVLPEVRQEAEMKNAQHLAAMPGIGASRTEQSQTFAQYATGEQAAPSSFPQSAPPEARKQLALYQPSEPLHDSAGNLYFFRLTEYAPAHATDLKQIAGQVAVDVTTAGAHDQALGAARKLLGSARSQGLDKAAAAQGIHLSLTPLFRPGVRPGVSELKLLPESSTELEQRAAQLLSEASPDNAEHPVALVDLPADRKVMVVELVNAEPVLPPSDMFTFQLLRTAQQANGLAYRLADNYFSYDSIKSRIDFHPEPGSDRAGM